MSLGVLYFVIGIIDLIFCNKIIIKEGSRQMLVLTNTAVRGNQLAIAHVPSKWEIRGGKGPFCDWFCMARG